MSIANILPPTIHHIEGIPAYSPDLAFEAEGFSPDSFEYLYTIEEHNFWFSTRNKALRRLLHKYADTADGKNWTRKDNETSGLQPGEPGEFDSEMLCYPELFDHNGKRYMLFNGNGYGQTGMGLAALE